MQYTQNHSLKKPEETDLVDIVDFNSNADIIDDVLTPTANPNLSPSSNGPGKVSEWVSWITNRLKSITGKVNWYDIPDITLSATRDHVNAPAPHSGHETPSGAQAKANIAENNAKNYAETRVQQVNDYLNAQFTLSGGGTVTWDKSYNLKWNQRFIALPVDKSQAQSGYIDIVMPASGEVISGIGNSPAITVTPSGLPLPIWTSLYAVHSIGGGNTSVTLKVANFNAMAAGAVEPNAIFIAARNGDDNQLKIGSGLMLTPGSTVVNGKQSIANIDGLQTALDNKMSNLDGAVADNKIGTRTITDTIVPTSDTGMLSNLLNWLGYMIKSITGTSSWKTTPATNLEAVKVHMDALAPHGGHVLTSDVVISPTGGKILKLDSSGKLPTSITGDSHTVDGKHASDFALASHSHSYLPSSGGVVTGRIVVPAGASGGIAFPNDAFGGGGDTATITLQNPIGGEATELTLQVTNDGNDIIHMKVPDNNGVKINGNTVWHAGNFNASRLISVTTGTISHGGRIPQTQGYTNYRYFVSTNYLYTAVCNNVYHYCYMDADRYVYVYSVWWGGTANYMEIAWN